jgi:hypothetical protein
VKNTSIYFTKPNNREFSKGKNDQYLLKNNDSNIVHKRTNSVNRSGRSK